MGTMCLMLLGPAGHGIIDYQKHVERRSQNAETFLRHLALEGDGNLSLLSESQLCGLDRLAATNRATDHRSHWFGCRRGLRDSSWPLGGGQCAQPKRPR